MNQSQINERKYVANRKSPDPKVRFIQALDDRGNGRDVSWARNDSDPKVAAVYQRANNEVTARQLGIVSWKRDDKDEDETENKRPRTNRKDNDYGYED